MAEGTCSEHVFQTQFPVTGQKRKYFKDSSLAHHRFLALNMPEKHPKMFGKH